MRSAGDQQVAEHLRGVQRVFPGHHSVIGGKIGPAGTAVGTADLYPVGPVGQGKGEGKAAGLKDELR